MTEQNCPVCRSVFTSKKAGHTYCKKLCRQRANPPKRGRCPVCAQRFGGVTGKHKPYCSLDCQRIGRARKRGGLALGDKAKNCQHCKEMVPRRAKKGPWPSVCVDCLAGHRNALAARWIAANPDKWKNVHRKHRAYNKKLRKSFEGVTDLRGLEDFKPEPEPVYILEPESEFDDEKVAVIGCQQVSFIIDLFEICHQAMMSGDTKGWMVVVSLKTWADVHYERQTPSKSTRDRGWERFKVKIRKLGLSQGDTFDEETGAVSLLFDPEFIRHATDKALGIDDSSTLE